MDNWFSYFQTIDINETYTLISKTEFFISFSNVTLADFDLSLDNLDYKLNGE